jgi:hypothetical protein
MGKRGDNQGKRECPDVPRDLSLVFKILEVLSLAFNSTNEARFSLLQPFSRRQD